MHLMTASEKAESGNTAIEFAFVLPVFIFLLYGLIGYGMIFGLKHTFMLAAAEGARAALPGAEDGTAQLKAETMANQVLSWMPASLRDHVEVDAQEPSPCPQDNDATCITVSVSYPHAEFPALVGLPVPDTLTESATVQL